MTNLGWDWVDLAKSMAEKHSHREDIVRALMAEGAWEHIAEDIADQALIQAVTP